MNKSKKVWFITGVSRGLGKLLAIEALTRGDLVIGTTRDGRSDIEAPRGTFHVLPMDVTRREQVYSTVEKAFEIHWRIDVVVNNAGYGLLGAIEEIAADAARDQFETNFFGALNVIQAVLPTMRAQRSGHILNISSIAGFDGLPGCGMYSASKFALEGLSESLSREMKPFDLNVTIVEPGAFRTDFLSEASIKVSIPSDEYESTKSDIKRWNQMDGQQAGDPVRAARAIVDVVHEPNPPLRLVLGPDAFTRMNNKIARLNDELARYETVSRSTDFDFAGVK